MFADGPRTISCPGTIADRVIARLARAAGGRCPIGMAAASAESRALVAMDHMAAKGDDRLRQDGKPP